MSYLQTTLVKALHVQHMAEQSSLPQAVKAAEIYGEGSAVTELINQTKGFINGSTTDYAQLQASSQFINLAKERSIIGAIEATGKPVIHMPLAEHLLALDLAPAQVVAQAYPTQILNSDEGDYTLNERKLGGFIIVNDRVLSEAYFPKVEPLINQALINSYVHGENLDFVNMLTSAASPSKIPATANFKADLLAALAGVADVSNAVVLMNPKTALELSASLTSPADTLGVQGGIVAGVPVIASTAVTPDQKIVLDCSKLVLASNSTVELRKTNEAVVKDSTGQNVLLFQQNKTAIMLRAFTGYGVLEDYQPKVIEG